MFHAVPAGCSVLHAAGPPPSTPRPPSGLDLLRHYANVETSYNLSPEDFKAKAPHVDALIVRSGTKVRQAQALVMCMNQTA